MRVKGGTVTKNKRKRILNKAEGYWGSRSKLVRTARQSVVKAGKYAFRDRRVKRREFRKLWISRMNAALREMGISYSKFMGQAKIANIEVNRKMLSELAINNPEQFKALVNSVMKK